MAHFKENWDWIIIFSNPNINYDVLAESKLDLSEQIKHVFATRANTIPLAKNLTANFIKKYKGIFMNYKADFLPIHVNGILTLQDIKEDPDLIINYTILGSNPNLTIDYVIANNDKPWNMDSLSQNEAFKMKDILKGFENGINWIYQYLSENPNITFDFIWENRNQNWDVEFLSSNPFTEQRKITLKYFGLGEIMMDDINNIVLEY